jgi:hypothetical protein
LRSETSGETLIYIIPDAAGVTIELYDLILMPVDEMAFMVTSTLMSSNTGYTFNVSSLDDFRLPNRAILIDSIDQLLTFPQIVSNQKFQLRANISQRLWFLSMEYDSGDKCWLGDPFAVVSVYVNVNPQYLSMRGER